MTEQPVPPPPRCKALRRINTWPYAKRCENNAVNGTEYCEEHKDYDD